MNIEMIKVGLRGADDVPSSPNAGCVEFLNAISDGMADRMGGCQTFNLMPVVTEVRY